MFNDFLRNARWAITFHLSDICSRARIYLMTFVYTIDVNCSSVDEGTKEKLAPFATLTGDESYASRDLEKVCFLRS